VTKDSNAEPEGPVVEGSEAEDSVADDVTPDATEADETGGTDADDADAADYAAALGTDAPPRTRLQRLLIPAVVLVLFLASAGVASWMYFAHFRPDVQTNDAAKATVIEAASTGTTLLLSYSPDSLDKDFANAKTHLTGDFLNYYTQFTHDIVTPAAKEKSVKTSASIVQSAVAEMHPTSAVVLLYLNQTTTSKENPDGSFTASSVKVEMTKVGNDWLISSFDPV
jgi:Mce-associated membrane protein